MKKVAFILVAVLSLDAGTASGIVDVKGETWQTLPAEHFSIHHKEAPYQSVRRVKRILEGEFERVVRHLGSYPVSQITVFVCGSRGEYKNLTGGTIPRWGSAVTYPAMGVIVLSTYRGSERKIRETLVHELAHAIVGGASGDKYVPRWFFEGTAMWVSRGWRWIDGLRMNRSVIFSNILSFEQIEEMFTLSTLDVPLAYTESAFAVRYLTETHGNGVLPRILWKMSRGEDFKTAFYEAAGFTERRFQREALTAARNQFGLRSLIAYQPDVWIIMTILFLVAYVAIKYRNYRTVKRWKREEEILARLEWGSVDEEW